MVVKFYSPVLNGFRLFIAGGCSFTEAKSAIQEYVVYNPKESGSIGRTVEIDSGTILVWVDTDRLDAAKEPGLWRTQSVICHEGLHVALRASEWINAHSPQEAEEPLAYLLSVYGVAWEILRYKLRWKRLSRAEKRWTERSIANFNFQIFE